jgi:hypothetical protein
VAEEEIEAGARPLAEVVERYSVRGALPVLQASIVSDFTLTHCSIVNPAKKNIEGCVRVEVCFDIGR